MGFRLASAIGGFARRTSQNLDALQAKADDITKTAAKTFAEEANAVRKARISSRGSYSKIARRLASNYNLNNAQIYSLLAGGLEQADLFQNTVEQAKLMHDSDPANKGKEFDMGNFIQTQIFKQTKDFDATKLSKFSIADQADAYAMSVAPMINNDFGSIAEGVQKATTTALFGGQAADVTQASFDAEFNALTGGQPIPQKAKMDFGTGTMYTVDNLTSVGAADTLAAKQTVATTTKIETETAQISQYTNKIKKDIEVLETNIKINEAKIPEIEANVELIKANTGLTNERGKKIVLEAKTIQNQLDNFTNYNKEEKELGIALLKQKILNLEGSTFTDLEQFQVALLNKSTQLKEQARNAVDGTEKAALENEAQFFANQIGIIADEMNQANPDTDDVFSKSSPENIFNSIVDRNLQSFIPDADLQSFGDVIKYNVSGKMPQYFAAVEQSIQTFSNRYGGDSTNESRGRADKFIAGEIFALRTAIKNYALQTDSVNIIDIEKSTSAQNKQKMPKDNIVPIKVDSMEQLNAVLAEVEQKKIVDVGEVIVIQRADKQYYYVMGSTGELIG